MPQESEPGNIDKEVLEAILEKAQGDEAFRNKVISSPEEVFKDANLGPQKKDWVGFFKKLTPENFESEIQSKIDKDPDGEAEAEAEATAR
jgi:hypothetical protein